MIKRLVEVHRLAVPTAPKTAPIIVILISASGVTIMALFPLVQVMISRRSPTVLATILPIRVDPVAETNGILVSFVISSPIL